MLKLTKKEKEIITIILEQASFECGCRGYEMPEEINEMTEDEQNIFCEKLEIEKDEEEGYYYLYADSVLDSLIKLIEKYF